MKTTPENRIKKMGIALLDEYNVFHYPASAGPYSVAGIPDRVGCFYGRFFGIEFKAPGKKPTALQLMRRDQIVAAGGEWFLVDSPETLQIFHDWLHRVIDEEA